MQELKWRFRHFPRGTPPSPAGPTARAPLGKEEREQLKEGILVKGGPVESSGWRGLSRCRTETSPREKVGGEAAPAVPGWACK